ncbi:BANQUO 3, BASIC HELIX-LOOP-HELIX PROTEIN 161 [Hibiscus trionum]|uniref:BANQUO 3, BASIC HELIX-LOOP-HELIX PROTEIN 161 n=1 Tax=Hibiscus trionum TaxID=183268 RepID=A0A9W7LKU1_HIBTR|nr:BANQUO 3, BASIC HELIX-LOOP-HELIX PROTEIN 161 [Hibiscus trionum]
MSTATSNENEDFRLKLHDLLSNNKKQKRNVNKLLEEICSHIKKLNGEVDDLSIRISELMASLDNNSSNSINANTIRQLLQQ